MDFAPISRRISFDSWLRAFRFRSSEGNPLLWPTLYHDETMRVTISSSRSTGTVPFSMARDKVLFVPKGATSQPPIRRAGRARRTGAVLWSISTERRSRKPNHAVQPSSRRVDLGPLVDAPKVRQDPPLEIELFVQPFTKRCGVCARVRPVQAVVRAHDGHAARVNGVLEGPHVQLVRGPAFQRDQVRKIVSTHRSSMLELVHCRPVSSSFPI